MATGHISKRTVDAITIPEQGKRSYLWDDQLKGFGCMVTDKGSRSYLVQYRIGGRGAKTRRVTIGKHGSPWTADTARSRAKEILQEVWSKIDPYEKQQEALSTKRKEEELRASTELLNAKLAFDVVAEAYIAKAHKELRRSAEQEGIVRRDLIPFFKQTPLPQITADDINDRLAAIRQRSNSAALKSYVAVKAIFELGHTGNRKLFPRSASPMADVERPKSGGKRTRYLNDEEIRAFWDASKVVGWPFGPIYQLLLLTGLRLRNVAEGRWSEIDFDSKRWLLSADRMKSDRAHWVHLSEPTLAILRDLPRLGDTDFIFSTNGRSPVSGFSRAKNRQDAAMQKALLDNALSSENAPPSFEPYIIHDLRRTFARGCQRIGIDTEITDRLIAHQSEAQTGIKGVYMMYEFENERVQATERWGQELLNITTIGCARVISIRGAA